MEVVAEYNILRELLSNIAERQNVDTTGDPNRILNRVVDRAVALAVDTYAKEKALEIQQRREEQLSFLIHDLKTPLSAIHAAGRILETSLAGDTLTGRVGNMLDIVRRNALRLNALITTASQEQYNLAASTADGGRRNPGRLRWRLFRAEGQSRYLRFGGTPSLLRQVGRARTGDHARRQSHTYGSRRKP